MTADDRRHAALVVGALALVAVGAFVPAFASGVPANQIPVHEAEQAGSLAQPTGDAWQDANPVTIQLSSAPSGVPDAADTSVRTLAVRAAHTDERLYVRVSWPDATRDESTSTPRGFADAVAVQLPANASAHPAIAMGSPRTPVNVWYWNAAAGTEELLAGGPGSTTAFGEPALEAATAYRDGRWHVVFERPLTPDGENRTTFRMQRDVDVAFAVWNGSNMERSGRKAVSEWYRFPLGPPPQGPPYEMLLWGAAGFAIVVVIVVTLTAVRRTQQ